MAGTLGGFTTTLITNPFSIVNFESELIIKD
jgi:hypothetical protein